MLARVALSAALLAAAAPASAGADGLVYDFTDFWEIEGGAPLFEPLAYDAAPLIDWRIPEFMRLDYRIDEIADAGEEVFGEPDAEPLPYDLDRLVSARRRASTRASLR